MDAFDGLVRGAGLTVGTAGQKPHGRRPRLLPDHQGSMRCLFFWGGGGRRRSGRLIHAAAGRAAAPRHDDTCVCQLPLLATARWLAHRAAQQAAPFVRPQRPGIKPAFCAMQFCACPSTGALNCARGSVARCLNCRRPSRMQAHAVGCACAQRAGQHAATVVCLEEQGKPRVLGRNVQATPPPVARVRDTPVVVTRTIAV
jgi:hypothetical protein